MIFIMFIMDSICSKYLVTLFTVLMLLFIHKHENKYLYTLIVGILYDVLYTDTLFLNTLLFFFIIYLVDKIFKYLRYNLLNVILVEILIIIIYRTITYIILTTIGYIDFDILKLFYSILVALPNILFVILFYYINNLTNKRIML